MQRPAMLVAAHVALYAPSYAGLAQTLWRSADDAHGPVLLAAAGWSLWTRRAALARAIGPSAARAGTRVGPPTAEGAAGATAAGGFSPAMAAGWLALAAGLACYVIGRALSVPALEMGSQVPVLAGALLALGGRAALRPAAFALLLVLLAVPLPGNLVDALTGSMKQAVSAVAESMLHAAGYPVARSGVTISVGQYRLLVADACSGLKSVFSLTAVGMLYVMLMRHASAARNLLLALATVAFALAANLARVIALILVTYHLGDAAGQGFAHDFAGIALFVCALLLLVAFDRLLGVAFGAARA